VGTSAIGPAASPYQVVNQATAATIFGLNGTLIRGMSEVAAYCDNIYLYRMGTTPGTFLVGQQISGSPSLGPSNTINSAVAVGGVITYTLSTAPTTDLAVGVRIQVTGFTNDDFNSGSTNTHATYYTIASVNSSGHTITIDEL
jgi:hypothetical protein